MSTRKKSLWGLLAGAAAAIAVVWADYQYAERRLWELRKVPRRRRKVDS